MTSGIGFQFSLDGEEEFEVDAAIDWLRATASVRADSTQGAIDTDSFANVIFDAAEQGFRSTGYSPWHDHNLFSLLSTFIHGGGAPWFEDVYTLAGFMIDSPSTCRIYVRLARTNETCGLRIPLMRSDGRIRSGMAGSLPQALTSLINTETLFVQPELDAEDTYCSKVFDMTTWVDPPTP
ncbi:hypothetical protein [Krasilnikovia sp. MM14-A1259]|uniref:hypothetical protein n=1 Tax=Krasilnikovia sp. MM14-A1259 TaxID=3373539 RepID=UPI00399D02A5